MHQDTIRLPNFIIGGAPRTGTTWLHHVLQRHPQIYMARPVQPEPKFFLVDDLYAKGLEYYSTTWFVGAPKGKILGEKTTNYLESRTVAERMHRHLPHVKLVFNLREPGARAYSNYLWSRQTGMTKISYGGIARTNGRRGPAARFTRPHAYFSRGLIPLPNPLCDFWTRPILCQRFEDIPSSRELRCNCISSWASAGRKTSKGWE